MGLEYTMLDTAEVLAALLDAKYGGANWANLEYFEERMAMEQWCLSRAESPEEYNGLVGILDPLECFNTRVALEDWHPSLTRPETIPNWAGTLYKDRTRLCEELWGTNTKGEHNLVTTPLLELWQQSKNLGF